MANEVLQKVGDQIIFADHAVDWGGPIGGTAKTSLEVTGATDVDLDLTSLSPFTGGVDTDVAESDKFDFGASRAARYSCMASIETGTGVATGLTYDFYLAPSTQSVAADGNPAQIAGVDTQTFSGIGVVGGLLRQSLFIGSLVVNSQANSVQTAFVGVFSPPEQYGILIVINSTTESAESNANEHHIVFNPIVDEIQ